MNEYHDLTSGAMIGLKLDLVAVGGSEYQLTWANGVVMARGTLEQLQSQYGSCSPPIVLGTGGPQFGFLFEGWIRFAGSGGVTKTVVCDLGENPFMILEPMDI